MHKFVRPSATNSLSISRLPAKKKVATARKACKLDQCPKKLGDCMHCTCDGTCGQHEAGKCGERREGSGPSCKRPGCPRDDSCTHSTRASCCRCRNLVFSLRHRNNSQTKPLVTPKRATLPEKLATCSTKKQRVPNAFSNKKAANASSKLRSPLASPNTVILTKEWKQREKYCNLIIVVEGRIYHLHKYPVLLRCKTLNDAAKKMGSTIPFIRIHEFPGGKAMFEKMMIHCYHGTTSGSHLHDLMALTYSAAQFLGMTVGPKNMVGELEKMINKVYFSNEAGSSAFPKLQTLLSNVLRIGPLAHSTCRELMNQCIRSITTHLSRAPTPDSLSSLTLPPDDFVKVIASARKGGVQEDRLSLLISNFAAMYIRRPNVQFDDKCRALPALVQHIQCRAAVSSEIGKSLVDCGTELRKRCTENSMGEQKRQELLEACARLA